MTGHTLLALAIICTYSGLGQEAGTVRYSPGFPRAIPGTGSAIVMGSACPTQDFKLRGAKVNYWIGGGVVRTANANLRSDGSFGCIINGLKPGERYWVMVEIVETRDDEKQVLANIGRITIR